MTDANVLWCQPAPGSDIRPIVAAQHPLTAQAGLAVLERGGTAADALVAMVAMDQVVVPGTSSLGGPMALIYHEQATGHTYSLNANLNTLLQPPATLTVTEAKGAKVLVPGTVAGLEAVWQRFGQLEWAGLWSAAIERAAEGFPLYSYFANLLKVRQAVVLSSDEGRTIFAPEGSLPGAGTLFRQPMLAATLQGLAQEGAAYFYRGAWAEALVAAVQKAGGTLTEEDLARYEVVWQDSLNGTYLDYEIRTVATPQYGGASLLWMLNLAEALHLHERPSREESAATLADEIQIFKLLWQEANTGLMLNPQTAVPAQQAHFDELMSKEYARQKVTTFKKLAPTPFNGSVEPGTHQISIIDQAGNMLSATHTIASQPWGDGLFVGGIALNSSDVLLQAAKARFRGAGYNPAEVIPPGSRLPQGLSCYLVMHNGQPLFTAGALGGGLIGCNFQNTVNVLGHRLSLADSVERPRWGFLDFERGTPIAATPIQLEPFDEQVVQAVEASGQPVSRRNRSGKPPSYPELNGVKGYADSGGWTAVGFDPITHQTIGVTDPRQSHLFTTI